MSKPVNSRSIILDILIEINEKDQYTHIVLKNALTKYQYLPHADRAFISRVVLGTVERLITLDYIIDSFSKLKTAKMKPVIRNILRMSVYQLVYMEGTEDFAACNEAVKLACGRGYASLKGFVNGVLRNIGRNKADIAFPDEKTNRYKYLSVTYSTPEWLIKQWSKQYPYDTVKQMLMAQYVSRPLTIRCNVNKITPQELQMQLTAQGIKAEHSSYLPEALEISGYDYLDKIPEFNEGCFFIQDISSMLVCHVAAPKENDYVIDVCAAPGGKSMHMAEMLKGTGNVDARDISEAKADMIRDNINRLKLTNVSVSVMDAEVMDPDSVNKADIVLADLPCSGLGIINKKPDIKYHASAEKCHELAQLQRRILDACAEYVKPGGTLIYSTCTVNSEENIENALWFAKEHPFVMTPISERLPKTLRSEATDKGYIELVPGINSDTDGENNYDGFFIAAFERV